MSELKIFAADHRNLEQINKKWLYPFTRIGTGFNNDAELKDIEIPVTMIDKDAI